MQLRLFKFYRMKLSKYPYSEGGFFTYWYDILKIEKEIADERRYVAF